MNRFHAQETAPVDDDTSVVRLPNLAYVCTPFVRNSGRRVIWVTQHICIYTGGILSKLKDLLRRAEIVDTSSRKQHQLRKDANFRENAQKLSMKSFRDHSPIQNFNNLMPDPSLLPQSSLFFADSPFLRLAVSIFIALFPLFNPEAHAAPNDTTADAVWGQPNFGDSTVNNGGISANSLLYPRGGAFDAQGRLYGADQGNSRILIYNGPASGDTTADTVLGQPGFTTNTLDRKSVV